MSRAIGFIEVYGLTAALIASDAAAKMAPVEILSMEPTKSPPNEAPIPLMIVVKIRGDLSSVREALAAGALAASKICGNVETHIIAQCSAELMSMIELGKVGPESKKTKIHLKNGGITHA